MPVKPTIAFLDSLGGGEVLVIFAVILLLFGPRRLPEMARLLGRTSAQLQRAFQAFKDQLMEADAPDRPPPLDSEQQPESDPPEEYAEPPDTTDDPPPPRAG